MENLNEVQKVCIEVFQIVGKSTSIFILPLFIGQVAYANASAGGNRIIDSLKGVLLYFTLITAFPFIIEILFSIPESFLPKFSILSIKSASSLWSGVLPFGLMIGFEVLLSALYWVAYYVHIFFMLIMCSMAPIVFLGGSILGVGIGVEIFMGLLIIGSSWPFIWYGFDQIHAALAASQQDEFATRCLELLLILCKGIAPISFASAAVKSPVGKTISTIVRASGGNAIKPMLAANRFIPGQNQKTSSYSSPQVSNYSKSSGEFGARSKKEKNPKKKDRLESARDRKHQESVPNREREKK
jgi:hypothetical protein